MLNLGWEDYLPIGLALAVYLTYMNISNIFLLVPFVLFFLTTGIKRNVIISLGFFRKYWWFSLLICIYIWYFIVNNNPSSVEFIVASFFMVLAGYLVSLYDEISLINGLKKMWIIMVAFIVLGIFRNTIGNARTYFAGYPIEFFFVIVMAAISILFMRKNIAKIVGILASLLSIIVLLPKGGFNLSNGLQFVEALKNAYTGELVQILLGRGIIASRIAIPESADNTFSAFLYDFGFVSLVLYVGVFIFAFAMLIKSNDKLLKKQSVLVILTIFFSAFSFMIYFTSSAYMVYSLIGIMIGRSNLFKNCERGII